MLTYFRDRMGVLLPPTLFFVIVGFVFFGTGGADGFSFGNTLFTIETATTRTSYSDADVRDFVGSKLEGNRTLAFFRMSENGLVSNLNQLRQQRNAMIDDLEHDPKELQQLEKMITLGQNQMVIASSLMAHDMILKKEGIIYSEEDVIREFKESDALAIQFFEMFNDDSYQDFKDGKPLSGKVRRALSRMQFEMAQQHQIGLYAACSSAPLSSVYSRAHYSDVLQVDTDMITLPLGAITYAEKVTFDEVKVQEFYDRYKTQDTPGEDEEGFGYQLPGKVSVTCITAVSEDFTFDITTNANTLRQHYNQTKFKYLIEEPEDNTDKDENKEKADDSNGDDDGEEAEEDKGAQYQPFHEVREAVEKDYRLTEAGKIADKLVRDARDNWKEGQKAKEVAGKSLYVYTFEDVTNLDFENLPGMPGAQQLSTALGMDSGETSEVVQCHKGPFVFRVDSSVPPSPQPLEEIRDKVLSDMRQNKRMEDARALMNTFKTAYTSPYVPEPEAPADNNENEEDESEGDTVEEEPEEEINPNDENLRWQQALKALRAEAKERLGLETFTEPVKTSLGQLTRDDEPEALKDTYDLSDLINRVASDEGMASDVVIDKERDVLRFLVAKDSSLIPDSELDEDERFETKWENYGQRLIWQTLSTLLFPNRQTPISQYQISLYQGLVKGRW